MLGSPNTCTVKTCCCGLSSLRTGCLIIGSYQIVAGLSIGILNLNALITDTADSTVLSVVDLILSIVIFFLGIVLIHGTRKKRAAYLKVWFYPVFVMVAIEVFITILAFLVGLHWFWLLQLVLREVVFVYSLVVVRTHFHVLQGDFDPTSA